MHGERAFVETLKRPPFNRLHPQLAGYFKHYLSNEKVVPFGEQFVLNTSFPPYPGPAFENLVSQLGRLGEAGAGRLYSVTLAVTNRCSFDCWHCYNAGRSQEDLPLEVLAGVGRELQDLGAVMVTLTGGEPLQRDDLEQIARAFDSRSCLIVGTTGVGLGHDRARALRESGVFAAGISLDSADPEEHDRMRGRPGAFAAALDAVRACRAEGLYPYLVSVATREFLQPKRFWSFMRLAAECGALEVHLLEPSATGRLAGRTDVLLSKAERQTILEYQRRVARDDTLPILSSFTYLESPGNFGCGAGLTHLYVDGSGEVCPCNLVPLSFGSVRREPLVAILDRMHYYFRQPRAGCVGRLLARDVPEGPLPTAPEVSCRLCEEKLPRRHRVPRFFALRSTVMAEVGAPELKAAYDHVHEDYDEFWLREAGKPVGPLLDQVKWRGHERVFEAGCGTGYATEQLAARASHVTAVDLSPGMLARARQRLLHAPSGRVELVEGDALDLIRTNGPFDVVFSSWVLGYIPLRAFIVAARDALSPGGHLVFIVHRENSPREPLEIFAELVARDPSVLLKRVGFDFPRDQEQVREELRIAGLEVVSLREGSICFRYESAVRVLEHLLKSGAGTAFYEAVDPTRREALADEFVRLLSGRHPGGGPCEVVHEYVACVARRASQR